MVSKVNTVSGYPHILSPENNAGEEDVIICVEISQNFFIPSFKILSKVKDFVVKDKKRGPNSFNQTLVIMPLNVHFHSTSPLT